MTKFEQPVLVASALALCKTFLTSLSSSRRREHKDPTDSDEHKKSTKKDKKSGALAYIAILMFTASIPITMIAVNGGDNVPANPEILVVSSSTRASESVTVPTTVPATTIPETEATEPPTVPPTEPETKPVETVPEKSPVQKEEPTDTDTESYLTTAEIELIATMTMAEAEGESELGKRLVIDVILNRLDDDGFPNTVHGVIYEKNQFEPLSNGRFEKCYPREDIVQLVKEEMENRTNDEVLYFRMGNYHSFATPLFQHGAHYFSGE